MGYTSTEVKYRYNKKTYKQWNVQLKKDFFDELEEFREKEGLSRSEFLKMLVKEKYPNSTV